MLLWWQWCIIWKPEKARFEKDCKKMFGNIWTIRHCSHLRHLQCLSSVVFTHLAITYIDLASNSLDYSGDRDLPQRSLVNSDPNGLLCDQPLSPPPPCWDPPCRRCQHLATPGREAPEDGGQHGGQGGTVLIWHLIKVILIIILIPNLIIIEKVRLIRQPKRAGLMRTRMVGVMESKSQVYKYIV